MLIHYVRGGNAYLPELAAYADFLQGLGHQAQIHQDSASVPGDAAVVWWLCGRVPRHAARRFAHAFQVHEYASASVPPWAWLKDRAKRASQPQPQYRLFQNAWVRARLGFADGVPSEFRDMGIASAFFSAQGTPGSPEFDVVYLGDMRRLRHFIPLLQGLERAGLRTLLIGEPPPDLHPVLAPLQRTTLTGTVAHSAVPGLLRRARFGLNLVPNQAPYHQQTSTKLLEYCAVGLPVVTTDYPWVRAFAQAHKARFILLPRQAKDRAQYARFFATQLDHAACTVPDLRALAWPRVLERLALWHTLGLHP